MPRQSNNSKIISARIKDVFAALTQKDALEFWLAPDGMTGKIHRFDFRVGGQYEMSLYYKDATAAGKTAGNEDRFTAKITDIVQESKITQFIKFRSDDDGLGDEMKMEIQLQQITDDKTEVTITFENIPQGINPKDNEEGTEQSLKKLAKFLEDKKFVRKLPIQAPLE